LHHHHHLREHLNKTSLKINIILGGVVGMRDHTHIHITFRWGQYLAFFYVHAWDVGR
jgi:hypothetical protein